jgi:hypothetical protein
LCASNSAGQFFRKYIEQEVRSALRNAGCRFPEDLLAEVDASGGLPKPGEDWLVVTVLSQRPAGTERGIARLVVREGAANVAELPVEKPRTNIGRVLDVYRSEGLFRRNDLVFAEDTPVNRTVSREHAHIRFDRATGEYRLFNDRWYPLSGPGAAECGTWIVREGMSLEVHRSARGTKLERGDEIHFGRAVVIFELD